MRGLICYFVVLLMLLLLLLLSLIIILLLLLLLLMLCAFFCLYFSTQLAYCFPCIFINSFSFSLATNLFRSVCAIQLDGASIAHDSQPNTKWRALEWVKALIYIYTWTHTQTHTLEMYIQTKSNIALKYCIRIRMHIAAWKHLAPLHPFCLLLSFRIETRTPLHTRCVAVCNLVGVSVSIDNEERFRKNDLVWKANFWSKNRKIGSVSKWCEK